MKSVQKSGIVATAAMATAFILVCVAFFWKYIPKDSPPPITPSDDITKIVTQPTTGTTTFFDRFWVATTPSEWANVGEAIDWNGIFTFKVEEAIAQKALPHGYELQEFSRINRIPLSEQELALAPELFEAKADQSGILTSKHLYLTITVKATCTGRYPNEKFGLLPDDTAALAIGNCDIGIYDRHQHRLVREYDLQSFRILSDEFYRGYGMFEGLTIGASVRMQIVFVIDEDEWSDREHFSVLFAPLYNRFNVEQLRFLQFDQPKILLNP